MSTAMESDLTLPLAQLAPLIAGAALLLFAALHDVAARTIPNSVSALLAVIGLLLRLGDGTILNGLMIGTLVFAVCTACWLRGWMGGGDVKLLSAAALFVPPTLVGAMIVSTSLFGGVVGLLYLAARALARRIPPPGNARPTNLLARIIRIEHWRLLRGAPLPYGSAIAAGTLFVILAR